MKENITRQVAFCQQRITEVCQKRHGAFQVGEEGDGYTCDACKDALLEEPPKVEWGTQ